MLEIISGAPFIEAHIPRERNGFSGSVENSPHVRQLQASCSRSSHIVEADGSIMTPGISYTPTIIQSVPPLWIMMSTWKGLKQVRQASRGAGG
jgi:hypothetical protein